jgi:hypothetical protein
MAEERQINDTIAA